MLIKSEKYRRMDHDNKRITTIHQKVNPVHKNKKYRQSRIISHSVEFGKLVPATDKFKDTRQTKIQGPKTMTYFVPKKVIRQQKSIKTTHY